MQLNPRNQILLKPRFCASNTQILTKALGLALGLCLLDCASAASENSTLSEWQWQGLLDLRYMHPDGVGSWRYGDLGKFSDGKGGNDRDFVNFNQAALQVRSLLDWNWSASLTLKTADRQTHPIDISEALLLFHPVSTSPWRFSSRLGAFLPPISMENTGLAWTSPYTLNSSAINSWVGEELKVFGGEAQLGFHFENGDKISAFAAGFANNDTAGVLLAWRGWSLDDYVATTGDSYALQGQIGLQGFFPKQALNTEPFVEVDGRPGFYTGLSVERPELVKVRALYYDNRGDPRVVKNGQYAWHTRFGSLGLKLQLAWDSELIVQGLLGETQMGAPIDNLHAVDASFQAGSFLLSKTFDQQRISVRYDRFATSEKDFLPQDPNAEKGYAWTCNYKLTFMAHHQLNFEMSYIDSNRDSRLKIGQAAQQTQTLWQIAYRVFF